VRRQDGVSLNSDLTPIATRPRCAHRGIPDNHKQIRPFLLRKVLEDVHNGIVDLLPVRLSKAHDKNAVVRRRPVFRETFVRRDERATFR
jgi:hypothetical protein